MEDEFEKLLAKLTEEQKEILFDTSVQANKRAKKAGVAKKFAEQYPGYVIGKRNRKIGIGILQASILLGCIYSISHYSSKQPEPVVIAEPAIVNTETLVTEEIPLIPEELPISQVQVEVPDRTRLAVTALEDAFEQNRSLHHYILSNYLELGGLGRERYMNFLHEWRGEFQGRRSAPSSEVLEKYNPLVLEMLSSPELPIREIWSRDGAQEILERFLRVGREVSYAVFHNEERNDLCLIEMPALRDLILDSFSHLRNGSETERDFTYLYNFISSAPHMAPETRLFMQSLLDDYQEGSSTEHHLPIIERVLNYSLTHQGEGFIPQARLNLDNSYYYFSFILHNHNWGRDESPGDLALSNYLFSVVVVYEQGIGFRTRHLYNGELLDTSRGLEIDAPHQEWFGSQRGNIEPEWGWEFLNQRVGTPPRYLLDFTYDYGIEYVVFETRNEIVALQHFADGPTSVHIDQTLEFNADHIYVIPVEGKPLFITPHYNQTNRSE